MIEGTVKSKTSIRREDIDMTDLDITRRYLGLSDLPCSIQSPLRGDDDNPSFSLMEKDGRVFWKDFGTGQSGSVIDLLMELWHTDYKETLVQIKTDITAPIPKSNLFRRYKGKVHITKNSSIKVTVRPWKKWDIEFWNSFGISKKMCEFGRVYPISHATFTSEDEHGLKKSVCVPMEKYAYAYFEWKDGVESIKLYQPYSTRMKWLSKHDSSVWDLWKQAFKYAETRSDEVCVITSSRKDALCIWNNLKIPAMSLQGEGYIPKPKVMQQVLNRFKTVYLWYDNDFKHESDNPGQDNAEKLIGLYPELKNICIPTWYRSKDPSDLYKAHGKQALIDVWQLTK